MHSLGSCLLNSFFLGELNIDPADGEQEEEVEVGDGGSGYIESEGSFIRVERIERLFKLIMSLIMVSDIKFPFSRSITEFFNLISA